MPSSSHLTVIDIEKDTGLMRALAARKQSALQDIMNQHLSGLLAFATRLVRERTDAEDIVQEAFFRLWQAAADWKQGGRIRPWLYTTTYRLGIDHIRRQARHAPMQEDGEPLQDMEASLVERADISALIGQLPQRQRAALSLYIEGYNHNEAAQIMDLSLDAFTSLLARARKTLLHHTRTGETHEKRRKP
ncbi:MAG: sigma-70 family RNA polymerase sigma factor [Alphaproteobacteria bacterium GM202ARS2]|nr:sigma-70 family RNA polymerase sigma factor [Alphaproteobacteria bacterium GM202ARS2]